MSSEAPKKRGRKPGSANKSNGPVGSRTSSVRRNVTLDDYPAIQVEGGLFTVEHVRKVAKAEADKQSSADYELPAGIDLKEEIGRSFRIATALWKDFDSARQGEGDKTQATVRFVAQLLKDCFGFSDIKTTEPKVVADMPYPIGRIAHGKAVPVVIIGAHQGLDTADLALGDGHRKRTASQLTQEYLNAEDTCLWAVCSNGLNLRILRDSDSLTRQSYFEANLERTLGEQLMADFALLWMHVHATRFKPDATGPAGCPLEVWHQAAQEEGSRVRDSLRIGVEKAMVELGSGFLEHRDGARLREALRSGTLKLEEYHQQVLRLVYRMLFLFAVEDRKILHPRTAKTEQVELYAEGYSLARLRERSIRHCQDRYDDIWDSLKVTFKGLAAGQDELGLPALGGIFDHTQCKDIVASSISNRRLLAAIRSIAWFRENDALVQVNYKSMGTEELGSVYESLLELTPYLDETRVGFAFVKPEEGQNRGNKRKTSGSYYTPDSLVQLLVESTIDPIIAERLKGKSSLAEKESAILSIKVLDPACGSGHFLLGASRRLAEALAKVRSESGESADYRRALRDVIVNCIHGVDRNPMAIELAKVALWLEGYVGDLPLGFLDANLVVGDSVLSIVDTDKTIGVIPAEAFVARHGEDENVSKLLAKRNRAGAEQLAVGDLGLFKLSGIDVSEFLRRSAPRGDSTLEEVERRRVAYAGYRAAIQADPKVVLSQMYIGAYIGKKDPSGKTPTTNEIFAFRNGENCDEYVEYSRRACESAKVLIWPVAFPAVFAKGGFDVVIANPPWDRMTLQEEEFFAARSPAIAKASNQSERTQMISALGEAAPGTPERQLYDEYVEAKRVIEASSAYAHNPARFPLAGRGIVNLYALFTETITQIISTSGRAGVITPTGLITDSNTSALFSNLVRTKQLCSIYDFENKKQLFAGVHRSFKFSLTTIGPAESVDCAFMLADPAEIADMRRRIRLAEEDFLLVNPSTCTAPIVRSQRDWDIVKSIYKRLPVLMRRDHEGNIVANPWGMEFYQLFNMSTNSKDFSKAPKDGFIRLYESKMFHHYDHRWNEFPEDHWTKRGRKEEEDDDSEGVGEEQSGVSLDMKQNPSFQVRPRYWAPVKFLEAKMAELPDKLCRAYRTGKDLEQTLASFLAAVLARSGFDGQRFRSSVPWAEKFGSFEYLSAKWTGEIIKQYKLDHVAPCIGKESVDAAADALFKSLQPAYMFGWRNISRSTDVRSLIPSILPYAAAGHSVLFARSTCSISRLCCLISALTSLPIDYIVRNKLGGTNLSYGYVEQLPIVEPEGYADSDLKFILTRFVELVYTANDMKGVYDAIISGYPDADQRGPDLRGRPFGYHPQRRTSLICELDAYHAYKLGLTRDELITILDSSRGEPGYPSESFRGLRDAEIKELGEYRTQRLVLEAWDRIVEPLRRGHA
jgi:hypothetical protein